MTTVNNDNKLDNQNTFWYSIIVKTKIINSQTTTGGNNGN